MKKLRTATFWIAVAVVPGGFLLLAPSVVRAVRRLREKRGGSAS